MTMRTPRPATAIIVALVALMCLLTVVDQYQPIRATDFFWHLKTGEWIWQHGALPAADPFASTTPANLNAMQRFTLTSYWLSQITFYLLYLAGGFPAIVALKFVFIGLFVASLLPRKRGDGVLFAGMLALGLVALGIVPLERPQSFSFALYGALLSLLASFRNPAPAGRARFAAIGAVPALMLLWANTHGAFLLGQATLLLVAGLEGVKFLHPALAPLPLARYRGLLAACLLGLVFSCVNPNTYHAIEYLAATAAAPQFVNVEYQSTLFLFSLNLYRVAVFWLLLLLTGVGLAARWRTSDITQVALLAGLGTVSFFTSRYAPFFIVAAVPAAAAALSAEQLRRWSRPVVVCLAVVVVANFAWEDRSDLIVPGSGAWVDRNFPEKAADFIVQQDIQGNLYNSPNTGGYLIWRLAPARKVFSDGRSLDLPSYLSTVAIDNAQPVTGSGQSDWRGLLEANHIAYVLTPIFNRGVLYPLVGALLRDRDWHLVFTGYNSLVFVRSSPENRRVVESWAMPKERFLDDAIAFYTSRSAADPGNAFYHLTLGELLMSRGRYPEARAAYLRVLRLAPFNRVAAERLQTLH